MPAQPGKQIYEPKTRIRVKEGFAFDEASSYSVDRAVGIVRRNSLIGGMVDVLSLWSRKAAYRYRNDDQEIYEFILGTPEGQESRFYQSGQLQGRNSIPKITSKLSSFPVFGNVFAEFVSVEKDSQWVFGALNKLHPGDYKFARLEETIQGELKGSIIGAEVNSSDLIPLDSAIYLRHGDSIGFEDPYGYAIYERLEPLAQAWKFTLEELMSVVGQQGAKKLIGIASEGKSPLLGPTGLPLEKDGEPILVNNAWLLADQLNRGSKNTDSIATTAPNDIKVIDNAADGDIFKMTVELLRTLILMTMLSPEGVFLAKGGIGGGGLAEQHTQTLMDFIDSIAESVAEEIQRVIIDNLVIWNFGPDRNRGALVKPPEKDPDRIALLNAISGFVEGTLISTESEMNGLILNKVRSLVTG